MSERHAWCPGCQQYKPVHDAGIQQSALYLSVHGSSMAATCGWSGSPVPKKNEVKHYA